MKEDVISILKELEFPFEEEDGLINFEYENEEFYILTEERYPFIQLRKNDMMTVRMDNLDEVLRLKSAINSANDNCFVSIQYKVLQNEVFAVGRANFLFESFVPNRKGLLKLMLSKFIEIKNYLKEEMLTQQYAERPKTLIN